LIQKSGFLNAEQTFAVLFIKKFITLFSDKILYPVRQLLARLALT